MPRKLKLQMQMTIDGFAAGPEGQLDWMTRNLDEKLLAFIVHLTDSSDTILLGRKMTPGFVGYWESVKPDSPEAFFARKMVDYSKVVFSKTVKHIDGKNVRVENGDLVQEVKHIDGKNVRVENGDLVQEVNKLKQQPGKDIIVYGGATFVSSLLEHNLIDELNIFVNPVAIGRGMGIFKDRKNLRLTQSTAYTSGVVVHSYAPER